MIRVNDDYVIEVDDMSYTIKQDMHRKQIDKKTNEEKDVYVSRGYFTSLAGALQRVKELIVANSLNNGEMSLEQAIMCAVEVNKEFIGTFNKIMGE